MTFLISCTFKFTKNDGVFKISSSQVKQTEKHNEYFGRRRLLTLLSEILQFLPAKSYIMYDIIFIFGFKFCGKYIPNIIISGFRSEMR